MSDATRPGRHGRPCRRPTTTAAVLLSALVALAGAGVGVGCGGDDDGGGDGEQAPTTALTESTLSPEQQAEADVIECLGPLSTDPNATVGSAEECTSTTATTFASAPGA